MGKIAAVRSGGVIREIDRETGVQAADERMPHRIIVIPPWERVIDILLGSEVHPQLTVDHLLRTTPSAAVGQPRRDDVVIAAVVAHDRAVSVCVEVVTDDDCGLRDGDAQSVNLAARATVGVRRGDGEVGGDRRRGGADQAAIGV